MLEGFAFQGLELLPNAYHGPLKQRFRKLARSTGLDRLHTTVVFVGNPEMKRLNGMYRGQPKITDVLSFSAWEGQAMPGLDHILGDVVIAVPNAEAQARACGHGLLDEVTVLVTHGLLHLLGLDHEHSMEEAIRQAECEMSFLSIMNVPVGLCLVGRSLQG